MTVRDDGVNAASREIERLSSEAGQTIRRVITQRFRPGVHRWLGEAEREDLVSTAMLRVLSRLCSERDPGGVAIEDFDRYVATVTLHACDDLVRERFPRRTAAKNRLVYVLLHDSRYGVWKAGGEMVCGLASWRSRRAIAPAVSIAAVRHLSGDRDVRRLLAAVFLAAQQPVELDSVVDIAAELWDMIDHPAAPLDDVQSFASTPTARVDDAQFLEHLWQEIRLLNQPQRTALLLNLRDDTGSLTEIFPLVGVATIAEVAEAAGLPLETFSELWSELPLEDLRIAALLGLSRQQVINLRRAARDRLRRRMRY